MAYYNNGVVVTKVAAQALSAGRFVKISGADDQVDYAATPASDIIYGVTMADAVSGGPVPVCIAGEAKLLSSGAITRGTRVTSAASGKGAAGATTNECGGIALETAANNDVFTILVCPGSYQK